MAFHDRPNLGGEGAQELAGVFMGERSRNTWSRKSSYKVDMFVRVGLSFVEAVMNHALKAVDEGTKERKK